MAIQGGLSSGALAGSANDQVQPDPVDGSQIAQGNQGALQNIVPYSPNTAIVPYPPNTALDSLNESLIKLQTQRNALNAQTELLLTRLNERQNRLLNPVLLGAAAGFLAPTTTGSFGESLSKAMANTADELNKEFTRDQATEKLKQELMEKQAQMAQAQAVQSHIMSIMEPRGAPTLPGSTTPNLAPPGAVETIPGVSGQGQGAPGAGAPGAGIGVLRSGAPRQAPLITERHVQEAMAIDPSGKLAQQYRDLMKLRQDDIITVGDLPYSRSQNVFFPGDRDKPVKVDLGKYIGVREIPRWLYDEWVIVHNHSVQKNDPWIEINWGISRNLIEGPRGKPGENLPLTVAQRAISDAATLEENKELAKKSAESIDALYASALQSYDIKNLSKEAIGLAEKNPNALKLMQNADVRTAYGTFLQAVQSGVQTPWGGFTLPGWVISKHRISNADFSVLQKLAQIEAAFSLMNRRTWLKGTGAVSDMETRLAAQLGPMSTDRPEVIRMKAEAVALKAEFEINASNAFTNWKEKNPSKRFNSFLGSEDYKNIRNDYDKKMESVFESNQLVFDAMRGQGNPPPAPPGPPAAASNANRPKSLVEKLEDARRQAEDARKRQAERNARGGQ